MHTEAKTETDWRNSIALDYSGTCGGDDGRSWRRGILSSAWCLHQGQIGAETGSGEIS